jgi:hypothetical protein
MKDYDVDEHISCCNNCCEKRNDRSPKWCWIYSQVQSL